MLKSIEMKQELENLNNKAKALLAKEDASLEEIQDLNNKIEILQAKIAMQEKIEADEKAAFENKKIDTIPASPKEDTVKDFANAARSKFKNAMTEGSNADGGYTVPQDIQTRINELRESKDALQNLVSVEQVSTPTGSRVFKTRSQQTGFAEVAEGGEITEKATPKFTNLTYAVKKYAGFMKATNELLNDSDQAIVDTIVRWIGDESRVTRNKKILSVLTSKTSVEITDADSIKKVLNVDLDPAFRSTAVVVTNQDGFNWLDTLKDGQGNYLLQPSAVAPTGKQLFGIPIAVVSNKDLPSDDDKAPIFIGDLKEAVVLFDRKTTEIKASDVADDAYLTDVTLFRAIERFEVKMRDTEAYVYGEIDLTPEA